MRGYIKLHRKLNETSFKKKPLVIALFVHLLLNANHKDNLFIWNGKETTVKAGQLLTGRKELSKQTGISEQSIRTGLTILKSTNSITIEATNKFSIISILNWGKYQSELTNKSTKDLPNKQPTTNQQPTTNKNDKNDKRETSNNGIDYLLTIPNPDLEEFTGRYSCTKDQVIAKGEALYNWCVAKGETRKNYKAFLVQALLKDFGKKEGGGYKDAKTFEYIS